MAKWNVRSAGLNREGLTVYQVQELIRAGQVGAADEASDGGEWKPIGQTPVLARLLPESASAPPKPGDVVTIHGIALRVGDDGKPRPPSTKEIIRSFVTSLGDSSTNADKARRNGTIMAALLAVVFAVVVVWKFVLPHP